MKDFRLTRDERNRLFMKIQEIGLTPAQFVWSAKIQPNALCDTLTHQSTRYFFEFHVSRAPDGTPVYHSHWSPPVASLVTAEWRSRGEQIDCSSDWLRVVQTEHEELGLWSTVAAEAGLVTGDPVDDERSFTPAARQALKEKLADFEAFIVRTQQLTPDEAGSVHRRFENASESADRLTPRDWLSVFRGLMTSALMAWASCAPVL
ncbi:MAG: hypothetical protein ABI868_05155 [Acidobacteriota bacterium]